MRAIGAFLVHQRFIWRNLRTRRRFCAGQAAVLRVICKGKARPGSDETELSRLVAVYGSALQDRVLSAGGQPNRVGGSGEVPGPEADRNWSLRNRVVRSKLTFNHLMDKYQRKRQNFLFVRIFFKARHKSFHSLIFPPKETS